MKGIAVVWKDFHTRSLLQSTTMLKSVVGRVHYGLFVRETVSWTREPRYVLWGFAISEVFSNFVVFHIIVCRSFVLSQDP